MQSCNEKKKEEKEDIISDELYKINCSWMKKIFGSFFFHCRSKQNKSMIHRKLTVVLSIGNVCDTAQWSDFDDVQPERQFHVQCTFAMDYSILHVAQHVLVIAFVTNGNYKSRSYMQCNAYPPKIDIWTDARYGAYRWYEIENLQKKRLKKMRKKKPMKFKQSSWVALCFFLSISSNSRNSTQIYHAKWGSIGKKSQIGVRNKEYLFFNMHYESINTNPAMCFMYIIELEDNGKNEAYK